jgi:HAD superfamily hydrolase (TIGR01509 family)
MRSIELVIFDCDGVLIDSELISRECALASLRSLGMNIDAETLSSRFLGVPRHVMASQVAAEGFPSGPDFVQKLEQSIVDSFEQQLKPIPGIHKTLSSLNRRSCVASGSALGYVRTGLEVTGLLNYFEANLFSATMVKRGKPAPDLFLHAAQAMGVAPQHCLVVEDSQAGIEAANAAGMYAFWFLGGSHINLRDRPPNFSAVHYDRLFDSMRDLPELISAFCEEPS